MKRVFALAVGLGLLAGVASAATFGANVNVCPGGNWNVQTNRMNTVCSTGNCANNVSRYANCPTGNCPQQAGPANCPGGNCYNR